MYHLDTNEWRVDADASKVDTYRALLQRKNHNHTIKLSLFKNKTKNFGDKLSSLHYGLLLKNTLIIQQ